MFKEDPTLCFTDCREVVAKEGPLNHTESDLTVLGEHLQQPDGLEPLRYHHQGAHHQRHHWGDHHLHQGSQSLDIAFANCSIGEHYSSTYKLVLKN